MVWPTPPGFTAGDADLDLASLILADGLSSRLNKALVYDRQLCTAVQRLPELDGDRELVRRDRDGAAGSLARRDREDRHRGDREAREDRADAGRARAREDEAGVRVRHGPRGHRRLRRKVRPPEPVQHAARRPGHARVGPGALPRRHARLREAGRRPVPRHQEPRPGALPPREVGPRVRGRGRPLEGAAAPASTSRSWRRRSRRRSSRTAWTSSSSSAPSCPRSTSRFVTRAGAEADPAGKAGLAHLTVTQIDMGTKTRKALEIEDALGDLGVGLTGAAGRESARVSLRGPEAQPRPGAWRSSPTSSATPAIRPPSSTARRSGTSTPSPSRRRTPNAVAARVRGLLAFGPEHPYGRPAQGLPSTIEKITREDLAKFHADYWKPGSLGARRLGRRDARRGDGAGHEVLRRLACRRRAGRRDPAARARPGRQGLRRRSAGRGADRRRPSSCRRRTGRPPTTTRWPSPTPCSAAAASARG